MQAVTGYFSSMGRTPDAILQYRMRGKQLACRDSGGRSTNAERSTASRVLRTLSSRYKALHPSSERARCLISFRPLIRFNLAEP
jgi:hypothetical protein